MLDFAAAKEVVLAAATQKVAALKFALNHLNQDEIA